MAVKSKRERKVKRGKKISRNFTIDCSNPVEDGIFDVSSFEKFLQDRIKVDGKPGNLKDVIKVTRVESKLQVTAEIRLSKRYLKYLTKKYLKKQQLRDWLHVVACSKNAYELRYFNISEEGEQEESDEE
ncbi:60S ribosomal protein L22 isoform 1 [Galdieria sulphuraria]|uniref:Large ribosomal subunit protein eL22 n=1 Tax=Galdieria sulphuraria TaxID=130081 RepID=M2Y5B8_GALSU|nr:60S ribosomal protein L22 isoform 1 [Galdieria sulphuraria]EME31163.1 60S ribosomal protein L22 isoform 1 [Galdieria sulphuraria]|eukprot:XP_005707683.1 60S ribosomal protein L22 isoform 1 [Galdieria sulphuraria]